MPTLRVDNIGGAGIIADISPRDLAREAWTDGENVRFRNGAADKFLGEADAFGALDISAMWTMPVQTTAEYYWIYASLTDVYATDGTTHARIASASFDADADFLWNGGVLGGVPVINPGGTGDPQQWVPGLTNKLAPLSNWPASMRARVLKPFKQFLVAANIDEGSGFNERLLRWSHPADPASVPSSWDYTDPTYDAGRVELADDTSPIIDLATIGNAMMVYKQDSSIVMNLIGGNNVFSFRTVFKSQGLLTAECAREFKNGLHFMVSRGDVYVHDGNTLNSVIGKRWRDYLFGAIDPDNINRMFVVRNQPKKEMWVCFPETGATACTRALIWNWEDNTWYPRDLDNVTYAAEGVTGYA